MYNKVYLNLDKALQSMNSKHNLVLLEGDSIIVPKTMDFVHISGELMNLEGGAISAPYFGIEGLIIMSIILLEDLLKEIRKQILLYLS